MILYVILPLIGLSAGAGAVLIVNKVRNVNIDSRAKSMIEKAKKDAERLKSEAVLNAKEEAHKINKKNENEIRERKEEMKNAEKRLLQREENMDRRDEKLQKREDLINEREDGLLTKQKTISKREAEVEKVIDEQVKELEKIAGYSKDKARDLILKKVEESMALEIAALIKEKEAEAKLSIDETAKNMLINSMEKYASDITNEQTVTVVNLPNDEMKGRIIGREGRNIRTIEAITGVDLIIDDTPEAVVLSSFDPLRREIARITMETLIKDGRIHPTRIEELYDKTCKDLNTKIMEYGKAAVYELGLTKLNPEVVELIGKLHFRTSYGQNALQHSKEVAHLAGIMAGEIGENVMLAKRAGLLHDLAKAIDFEMEGSHVEIGVELAKKFGENEVVTNAIASHHGDHPVKYTIAALVGIADTLSAARPGARNDSLENYVKRLQDLEAIGKEVKGVQTTFAVQAGRELRVIVKPEEVDDLASYKIARDIKEKIESTMQYPGTIKVTVIRETRAVEEAK